MRASCRKVLNFRLNLVKKQLSMIFYVLLSEQLLQIFNLSFVSQEISDDF